jgi:hypothetical protein
VKDYIENLSGDKETRDGIISRLKFLLKDERMVKILCGADSVEWGDLIAKQQTFIMDGFGFGKDKLVFAGNLITQGVKNYFRYQRPKEYKPIALYIDEARNFTSPNMFDLILEGRKYKINVIMATQDFSDIPENLKRAMVNSLNIICYRVGFNEASTISKEMGITPQELQTLEKYHAYYLTPEGKGKVKAPPPPFAREIPIRVEPQKKPHGWFTLESY